MADSDETMLSGLPGDNPLGLLAALGSQVALAEQNVDAQLHWTDHPIPKPILSPAVDLADVASAALEVASDWLVSEALSEALKSDLKLRPGQPDEIREYLTSCRAVGASGLLGMCLLAEGVASETDKNKAKPSDLYFTSANQKFVTIARTILREATEAEIVADIGEPWRYNSERESLMWDSVDDRLHAYSAADPAKAPKFTNPGAEALAVIGLSRYPCFASPGRTLTQGCSGSWKRGAFVWPLWAVPATVGAVRSLLAQVAVPEDADRRRVDWYRAWGISKVMQSQIRRSPQGGYGTFGPPRVVWQRE